MGYGGTILIPQSPHGEIKPILQIIYINKSVILRWKKTFKYKLKLQMSFE